MTATMSDVTLLINAAAGGDRRAARELVSPVYAELRRLAAQLLDREAPGQTLQPTALVHEAFLRLTGNDDLPRWDNRGHFFAAAAIAMRRVLVEAARRKQCVKRGGGWQVVEMSEVPALAVDDELLALDEALGKLATEDSDAAKVVELRYFAGLTATQAAEALGQSEYFIKQKWAYARAWLQAEIGG
jgi:RNA polymerase sigma factor (TIGR02999 family)